MGEKGWKITAIISMCVAVLLMVSTIILSVLYVKSRNSTTASNGTANTKITVGAGSGSSSGTIRYLK